MNPEVRADIKASADQAAAHAEAVAALALLVRSGAMSIDGVSPSRQDAVRAYLASQAPSAKSFFARQEADRRKFFRELEAQGAKVHRANQQDHDFIIDSILDTVDAGTKPAVKPLLRNYAERQGYEPEWAERVANKRQPKKMGRSLRAKKNHPVILDLKEGHMLTQTHQSALKNATYSGLAELLFSGSQSTREKQAMRTRMAALEARLAAAESEAARANARLDIKDAGLDWKEKARAILATEPGISRRQLAKRVGMAHTTVNQYWKQIKPCQS